MFFVETAQFQGGNSLRHTVPLLIASILIFLQKEKYSLPRKKIFSRKIFVKDPATAGAAEGYPFNIQWYDRRGKPKTLFLKPRKNHRDIRR